MLILLELTVLRFAWTFNFDYAHYILAGVIWMLGWSMILLAALVRLRVRTIAITGLAIVAFQQLLYPVASALPGPVRPFLGWFFQFLYTGGWVSLGPIGLGVNVLYVIVPWVGVMAAGYAFSAIMIRDSAERDRLCLRIGLTATAVFVVAAGIIVAVSPVKEGAPPALFRFLGQQKYPASQLFLLMTLGPTIALLPLAERARGWFSRLLVTFGRVPMFYYLLHIPLIHLAALVVSVIREGRVNPWLIGNHPLNRPPLPDGYQWSLPLLYLVFVIVIALLYLPCQWYGRVKAERPGSWLRFI